MKSKACDEHRVELMYEHRTLLECKINVLSVLGSKSSSVLYSQPYCLTRAWQPVFMFYCVLLFWSFSLNRGCCCHQTRRSCDRLGYLACTSTPSTCPDMSYGLESSLFFKLSLSFSLSLFSILPPSFSPSCSLSLYKSHNFPQSYPHSLNSTSPLSSSPSLPPYLPSSLPPPLRSSLSCPGCWGIGWLL